MKIKVKEIKIGQRFRKDVGDLTELKKSIEDIGLIHPPVIDRDKNLLTGYRRLTALRELGFKWVPVSIYKTLRKK